MDSQTTVHNPFMLLVNPEAVIAAMEKSERLGRLNRQLCRPLDRVAPGTAREALDPVEPPESIDSLGEGDGDGEESAAVAGDVTLS